YIASCPTRRPSDLLQPRRGQDHHRSLAAILQHQEATLVAWIQATGTRGHHLACASKRSSTVICPGNSSKADHELRVKPDHPMGVRPVFEAGLMLAVSLGRKMLLRSQKSAPYTLLLRSGFSASWRAVPRAESLRAITESRDGLRVSVQNGRMVGRPSVVGLKVKPCLR